MIYHVSMLQLRPRIGCRTHALSARREESASWLGFWTVKRPWRKHSHRNLDKNTVCAMLIFLGLSWLQTGADLPLRGAHDARSHGLGTSRRSATLYSVYWLPAIITEHISKAEQPLIVATGFQVYDSQHSNVRLSHRTTRQGSHLLG